MLNEVLSNDLEGGRGVGKWDGGDICMHKADSLCHTAETNATLESESESCSVVSDFLQPHGIYIPWNSPGQNTGVGSLSLLQEIFPTQGWNQGLSHCRQILYQLSHKGSPRILEWVAYPFSRGYSQPRNWTRVSCIAGRFFTNWPMRDAIVLQHCKATISSVQLLSCILLFLTLWTAAHQASLSITNSQSFLKLMYIELVMPSNHLIFCHPLLLLPSILPSIRVFSNESVLRSRWPKYWSFSFSISPSNEYSGLISFRIDWLDLLAGQGTLKNLLQHHSSKASVLQC